MTIKQAAEKWGLSANWVRHLVLSGHVPATRKTEPMPYYDIPDGTPKPKSLRPNPSAESAARNTRQRGAKPAKAKPATKAKAKVPKSKKASKSARGKSTPAGAPAGAQA